MQVADRLGNIYHDAQFTALFPKAGQPAEAPARLALATVLQFVEGLSDRQAADAVRGRIDWKYALGLELTDSTHVLAAVRVLNRLELVGETLRATLNELAVFAPEWLQAWAPAEWYARYGERVENYPLPKTDQA